MSLIETMNWFHTTNIFTVEKSTATQLFDLACFDQLSKHFLIISTIKIIIKC